MPTLSVYVVSVTVGGRGSAIIDWKKYIYTLAKVLQKIITNFKNTYMWQSRVEIEHYSVVYFNHITML